MTEPETHPTDPMTQGDMRTLQEVEITFHDGKTIILAITQQEFDTINRARQNHQPIQEPNQKTFFYAQDIKRINRKQHEPITTTPKPKPAMD